MDATAQQRTAVFGRATLLVLGATALACGSTPGPQPTLQVEVAQYIARVKRWAPAEREAAAAIKTIFRSQFVDTDVVTTVTSRVLPTVGTQVATLASYNPRTPEIGKIHARYRRAWRQLERGFKLIDAGMREDNPRDLAAGRRLLEGWSDEMFAVAVDLRDLADSVGLSETKSAGGPRAPGPRHS